ncbi:hypothetical protein IKF15_03225 [Candidatus Saccharibacteria bacterium]|nr:hypothetical protein [Candidatus Saccharibacteria bacterium]
MSNYENMGDQNENSQGADIYEGKEVPEFAGRIDDVEKARMMARAGDEAETLAVRWRRQAEEKIAKGVSAENEMRAMRQVYERADKVEEKAGEDYDKLQEINREFGRG